MRAVSRVGKQGRVLPGTDGIVRSDTVLRPSRSTMRVPMLISCGWLAGRGGRRLERRAALRSSEPTSNHYGGFLFPRLTEIGARSVDDDSQRSSLGTGTVARLNSHRERSRHSQWPFDLRPPTLLFDCSESPHRSTFHLEVVTSQPTSPSSASRP